MALTVTLTKQSVSKNEGIYTIRLNCRVNNSTVDVMDFDVTGRYNPAAPNLNDPKKHIIDQLKAAFDRYKAEQTVLNSAALDAAIADLQTQATTYINQ